MKPGRGVVLISPELLAKVLHMPVDALIVDARWEQDCVALVVASPALPDRTPIPTLCPSITHHEERYEWDWGIA